MRRCGRPHRPPKYPAAKSSPSTGARCRG
jgi:hypothetical protein